MRSSISRKITNIIFGGIVIAAATSLSACSLDAPSFATQKKVEVVQDVYQMELETAKLDETVLHGVAEHYLDQGAGPVAVTVTYDPASRGNTAMKATDNAARIASALRHLHVADVSTEILPVHGQDTSLALLSFTSYTARAPEDCGQMEAVDDTRLENYRDYELGCSMAGYFAQQVARPRDLLGGDEVTGEASARKRANVVEDYKARVRNPALQAERASGN